MATPTSQSETDIQTKRAESEALQILQQLAATLMRIARGSGHPNDIFDLAYQYVLAAADYREIAGRDLEPDHMRAALSVYAPATPFEIKDPISFDVHRAFEGAIAGALQVAASRLIADRTRQAQGEKQMFEAFNLWKVRKTY